MLKLLSQLHTAHNTFQATLLISFNKILSEYQDYSLCYTDGSKTNNKIAYAYHIASTIHSYLLRNSFSVFFAEQLTANLSCLNIVHYTLPTNKFLIISDFLSSLLSTTDPYLQNLSAHATYSYYSTITHISLPR